jgi:hypothetical protein
LIINYNFYIETSSDERLIINLVSVFLILLTFFIGIGFYREQQKKNRPIKLYENGILMPRSYLFKYEFIPKENVKQIKPIIKKLKFGHYFYNNIEIITVNDDKFEKEYNFGDESDISKDLIQNFINLLTKLKIQYNFQYKEPKSIYKKDLNEIIKNSNLKIYWKDHNKFYYLFLILFGIVVLPSILCIIGYFVFNISIEIFPIIWLTTGIIFYVIPLSLNPSKKQKEIKKEIGYSKLGLHIRSDQEYKLILWKDIEDIYANNNDKNEVIINLKNREKIILDNLKKNEIKELFDIFKQIKLKKDPKTVIQNVLSRRG